MKTVIARGLSGALRTASSKSSITGASTKCIQYQPKRDLNLLEYQSKGLLQKYNVTVQDFRVASTEDEAKKICSTFPCEEYVIKAQVLAGGRGKGHFEPNGFKVSIIVSNFLVISQIQTKGVLKFYVSVEQIIISIGTNNRAVFTLPKNRKRCQISLLQCWEID
jgi:hypothetical protein